MACKKVAACTKYWRFTKKVMGLQEYDNFLILDFEATCDRGTRVDPQEIIEFPCLKVNGKTFEIESTFHKYVKPTQPLSNFCTQLTGITQDMVDEESHFAEVFKNFLHWGEEQRLWESDVRSVFVTCGDWDLKIMLPDQCEQHNIPVPAVMKEWINIKRAFAKAMGVFPKRDLPHMTRILGLPIQGRLHSGIDDCKTIYTILRELAKRDYIFQPTSSTR